MCCCSCGGQMQPVRVVWEQGTTSSSSTTMGAAFTGRHFVPFVAGSSGRSQSLFAQRCAPPTWVSSLWFFWEWLFLGLSLFLGPLSCCVSAAGLRAGGSFLKMMPYWLVTLGFVFGGFICRYLRISVELKRQLIADRKYAQWLRTWICLNCGSKVVL